MLSAQPAASVSVAAARSRPRSRLTATHEATHFPALDGRPPWLQKELHLISCRHIRVEAVTIRVEDLARRAAVVLLRRASLQRVCGSDAFRVSETGSATSRESIAVLQSTKCLAMLIIWKPAPPSPSCMPRITATAYSDASSTSSPAVSWILPHLGSMATWTFGANACRGASVPRWLARDRASTPMMEPTALKSERLKDAAVCSAWGKEVAQPVLSPLQRNAVGVNTATQREQLSTSGRAHPSPRGAGCPQIFAQTP